MERTRIYSALKEGGRISLEALESLLVQFSLLVAEQRRIKEIDINPLLVSTKQIVALDARMILHSRELRQDQLPRLAIRPYPQHLVSHWQLRDGTPLTIRPIRPEDEPLMIKFHESLSEENVHFRYFGFLKLEERIAHKRLARICFNDYDREIAMVAVGDTKKSGKEQIIGVGRLSKIHGKNEAGFALVISDECHGKGLGTQLLQLLVEIGRQEHLDRIIGYILPDNYPMLRVCRKLSFKLSYDTFEDAMKADISL